MTAKRPNLDDPGYAQIGCVFVFAGLAVGIIAALVLLPFLTPAWVVTESPDSLLTQLIVVGLASVEAGFVALWATTVIVEHVRALWRTHELWLMGSTTVAAAVVIPLIVYVPAIYRVAGPIAFGILVVWLLALVGDGLRVLLRKATR